MSQSTNPLKIIVSKFAMQAKIMYWKFKYVSAEMIGH